MVHFCKSVSENDCNVSDALYSVLKAFFYSLKTFGHEHKKKSF